jgi:Protein of unknown function (DUF2933)
MEIAAVLPYALIALACPISMGLMMVFMAKGMGGSKKEPSEREAAREVESLRAEQARLAAEVERLEGERSREPEAATRE